MIERNPQDEPKIIRFPSEYLPGETKINGDKGLQEGHFRDLLSRILHKKGQIKGELPEMDEDLNKTLQIMEGCLERAEEEDKDAILITRGSNTTVMVGKWIADHKGLIEVSAVAVALGVTGVGVVTALVRKGIILRKHQRVEKNKNER